MKHMTKDTIADIQNLMNSKSKMVISCFFNPQEGLFIFSHKLVRAKLNQFYF